MPSKEVVIDAEAISEVCLLDAVLAAIVAEDSANDCEMEQQDFGPRDQLQAKKDETDHLFHPIFVIGAR